MPATVVISYAVKQAVQTILRSRTITGIDPQRILIRKRPKIAEQLDKTPCVIIAPYQDSMMVPIDFEGGADNSIPVEVALAATNNYDFSSMQETQEGWSEIVVNAIC